MSKKYINISIINHQNDLLTKVFIIETKRKFKSSIKKKKKKLVIRNLNWSENKRQKT